MKIGIIGNGQLGKEIFNRFHPADDVFVFTRSMGFNPCKAAVAESIVKACDVVVNCAAMTDVDGCEKDKQQAIAANAVMPAIVAGLCAEHKKKFVHVSTDFVYGDNGLEVSDDELLEDDPCNPVNFYGETKLAGDYGVKNSGADYLILRPSWLFGYFGKNNFIYKIKRALLDNQEAPLEVVDDQFGFPTSTVLVSNIIKIWLDGGIENGLYNVRNEGEYDSNGNPIYISRYDIAKFIKEEIGALRDVIPCKTSSREDTARRQKNSVLSIYKLKQQLKRSYIDVPRLKKTKPEMVKIPTWKEDVIRVVCNMG